MRIRQCNNLTDFINQNQFKKSKVETSTEYWPSFSKYIEVYSSIKLNNQASAALAGVHSGLTAHPGLSAHSGLSAPPPQSSCSSNAWWLAGHWRTWEKIHLFFPELIFFRSLHIIHRFFQLANDEKPENPGSTVVCLSMVCSQIAPQHGKSHLWKVILPSLSSHIVITDKCLESQSVKSNFLITSWILRTLSSWSSLWKMQVT